MTIELIRRSATKPCEGGDKRNEGYESWVRQAGGEKFNAE